MDNDFLININYIFKNNYSNEKIVIRNYVVDGIWDYSDLRNEKINQIQESELRSNWKKVDVFESKEKRWKAELK